LILAVIAKGFKAVINMEVINGGYLI